MTTVDIPTAIALGLAVAVLAWIPLVTAVTGSAVLLAGALIP